MKGFCKRIIACFSVLAMLVVTLGTVSAADVQQAPIPTVSSWIENGIGYPRTAEMSISYTNGTLYSGKYSLTALYNENREVIGIGGGVLDENGASNYKVQINSVGAATVKCFIFDDLGSVKPSFPVYKETYENFVNNIEFYVPPKAIGLRNSFESGLFQIFQNRTDTSYDAEIVENSSAAHTGTKYAKVTNRNNKERATLRVKMPNAEASITSTINVEAYMKKPETVSGNAEFYITVVLGSTSLGTQSRTGGIVSVSDNEWHKVSYSLDLSEITGLDATKSNCVVELGARTGSEGNYTYVDYCVDDFTVICPKAKQAYVFDDTKTDKLKWTFEGKNTNDAVTKNRNLDRLYDTNKWTNVLKDQPVAVEDTSAETNAPTGSTKMLTVQPSGDKKNAHVTARMKLSKLDIKPNKKYKISFWARGSHAYRALYIGLLDHMDYAPADNFIAYKKDLNYLASGIIDYKNSANYATNRAALMTTSWTKYTYTIEPKDASFNADGFADLYFVMVRYNAETKQPINTKTMPADDKLYLDEIEITEVESGNVAAIVNDGMYTKRAAFESDNMDMFSPQTRSSVVLTTATANTGRYSAEFSDRRDNWSSLGSSLKGAASDSNITVSAYLKKNQLRV